MSVVNTIVYLHGCMLRVTVIIINYTYKVSYVTKSLPLLNKAAAVYVRK